MSTLIRRIKKLYVTNTKFYNMNFTYLIFQFLKSNNAIGIYSEPLRIITVLFKRFYKKIIYYLNTLQYYIFIYYLVLYFITYVFHPYVNSSF